MRNTMKVQAVALAAMIAVAVVAGAGEAQAARRAVPNAAYGRTLERIPRTLEIAGKKLREVMDGWGQGVDLAKARLAQYRASR